MLKRNLILTILLSNTQDVSPEFPCYIVQPVSTTQNADIYSGCRFVSPGTSECDMTILIDRKHRIIVSPSIPLQEFLSAT